MPSLPCIDLSFLLINQFPIGYILSLLNRVSEDHKRDGDDPARWD
jgi:hypothetical protein